MKTIQKEVSNLITNEVQMGDMQSDPTDKILALIQERLLKAFKDNEEHFYSDKEYANGTYLHGSIAWVNKIIKSELGAKD